MLHRSVLLSFVLMAAIASGVWANEPPASSATLPLETILDMQKRLDAAAERAPARPPVTATVHRVDVSGRLLEDAAELALQFDLQVLDGRDWVTVPLLRQGPRTHLLKLPAVDDGAFAVVDGYLSFVTKKAKRYRFDLALLEEARVESGRRALRVELAEASMARCKLSYDEDLFELERDRVLARPDGALVLPTGGGFRFAWTLRQPAAVREARAKPEIAPVIPAAYASSVSTLEGMRITRLLYRLRFAGRKEIAFTIPPEQRVDRVYLNGVALPVTVDEGRLVLEAAPARAGDESATVELVLVAEEGVYHLAGDLALQLPRASWPTHEIFLDLYQPDVFTYRWQGGSLSESEPAAFPAFSYRVPEPGKRMSFHQFLVTTQMPHLSLTYAVDLEDQYFCVRSADVGAPGG